MTPTGPGPRAHHNSPATMGRVAVYLITDRQVVPKGRTLGDQLSLALEAVPPGRVAVQLREKDLEARSILTLCGEVAPICRKYGAPLLINSRADIAFLTQAGVHLPGNGLPARLARKLLPRSPIGASTHSEEEAGRAAMGGVDLVTFGPVFPTPSKLRYGPPVGPERLTGALEAMEQGVKQAGENSREQTGSPHQVGGRPLLVALGGITSYEQAGHAIRMGADAVGVIRAVMTSQTPGRALLDLVGVVLENRRI